MRGSARFGLALALLLGYAAPAGAHAFLVRAWPAVGSKVHAPRAEVRLRFTEELSVSDCEVRVLDQTGKRVDGGRTLGDPSDPRVLRVSVHALGPGTYKVIWRAMAPDHHVTEGDFSFTVIP